MEKVVITIDAKNITDEKPFIIAAVGDLQMHLTRKQIRGGSQEGFFEEDFKRYIDWCLRHDAHYIGMGDITDHASTSNRKKLKDPDLHDSFFNIMDDVDDQIRRRFLHLVDGTKGKWLGMVEGHHFWPGQDGMTTDQKLAEELGCKFLGTMAFIRLRFGNIRGTKKSLSHTMVVHHGVGSGIRVGAPLNKLEWIMMDFDADSYWMGHQSKLTFARKQPLHLGPGKNPHISHRVKTLIATGGWNRGYLESNTDGFVPRGSYVEKALMNPVALGAPVLKIWPLRERANGVDYISLITALEVRE